MFKTRSSQKSFIEYIKISRPRSSNHKVISQDNYLDGAVARVEFEDGENFANNTRKIEVWVVITKKHQGEASSERQLIQQLDSATKNKKNPVNASSIISGIISIIVVATLVYMIIFKNPSDVPNYLVTLVSTIIAFYFGGVFNKESPKKPTDIPR